MTQDLSHIYAGTQDSGVYISSNHGLSWTKMNNGLDQTPNLGVHILSMVTGSAGTIAAKDSDGVYITNNNGNNWYPSN